jgi:hypothetical protein
LSQQEIDSIKAELARLKKESDETKREDTRKAYEAFRKKYFRFVEPDDEDVEDPTDQPPTPEADGRPQPHKNADKDANKWKVVPMKDDPRLFKIVDDKNINVADLFHSQANAQKYIDQVKAGTPPPIVQPPKPQPPQPQPGGGTGGFDRNVGPYPAKGSAMASTQRGPTTRHYASGKPDDKTIEKNVKEIEFDNYQFVTFITMNEMEHNDTASHKLGGTHMGSGWFDNTVDIESGLCGLGTEKKHPSADLFIIKGGKIGSLVGREVGIATTYFTATNKTELWTNTGDGWKKQVEGTNVGNFKPDSDVDEAQLRIDGWKVQPTIHSAFVTEI